MRAAGWRTTLAAAATVFLALAGSARADDAKCLALARFGAPDTQIDRVEAVPAGSVRLFGAGNLPSGVAASAEASLPEHCLVRGVIGRRPSTIPGNTLGIGFELRLPATWNGRFFFQGGGGWDGWLRQASGVITSGTAGLTGALSRGFAVVSTDAGHQSDQTSAPTDGRFAADPRARTDNAIDAVTRTTAVAKSIVTAFYGRPIERAYFVGCSNGGREGMLEAQTRPADFDGIVSGDPAFDLIGAAIAWDWNERALTTIAPKDAAGRPQLWQALTDADLALLSAATGKACGADAACRFDVATLQCGADATAACLAPAKVQAIQAIQRGPHTSAGAPLYSPWTQGGESGPAGWRAWMLGTDKMPARAQAFVADWMRFVAVAPGTAPIDWLQFDFDRDPARIAGPARPWQATSTDYAAFAKRGGRILFYQGTADPAFSAIHLERYVERIPNRAAFSRLFLVPGMAHCAGGAAFDQFDPLGALVDWVERGQPPSCLEARGAAFPNQSRPLCPYPAVARLRAGADPAEAVSYDCAPP